MKVIAIDKKGYKFEKTITTRQSNYKGCVDTLVICFGGPIEYYASDLMKHYPFQRDMCIDMQGLNHRGSPVTISAKQMDKVIEKFIPIRIQMEE